MKYRDPELRQHLAAEFALGVLAPRARRRFERLMQDDDDLRRLAEDWELRLAGLIEVLPGLRPPESVWRRIAGELGWIEDSAEERRPSLWRSLALWRGFGLASAATALALILYVAVQPSPSTAPAQVAVLSAEDAKPVLVARVEPQAGRIVLIGLTEPDVAPGYSQELWLVPEGGAPVSLGLIGDWPAVLPIKGADVPFAGGALAVSLEPEGGSPTGAPTGPVLYQGVLVAEP